MSDESGEPSEDFSNIATVKIDDDKMKAYIVVNKPAGDPPTQDILEKIITKAGIKKGPIIPFQ